MRVFKLCVVTLATLCISILSAYQLDRVSRAFLLDDADPIVSESAATADETAGSFEHLSASQVTQRYRLDSSQSKFIAHALAGGLLWFKGHEHLVAVQEFSGEATLAPGLIRPASLEITAKADSMVETSSVFTEPQKKIINNELREIVLEPAKYPDIVFRSTNVTANSTGNNQYDLSIRGDLSLHGITRSITIPTKVTVTGNDLRAIGEFSISRGEFNVKATSAVHGLVRVRDKVKFTFDIIGHQH